MFKKIHGCRIYLLIKVYQLFISSNHLGCLIIWSGLFKENGLPVDLTGDEGDERARKG